MVNAEEMQEAIDAASDGDCKELVLLHCIRGYSFRSCRRRQSAHGSQFDRRFGLVVADLPDHTRDNITSTIISVTLRPVFKSTLLFAEKWWVG